MQQREVDRVLRAMSDTSIVAFETPSVCCAERQKNQGIPTALRALRPYGGLRENDNMLEQIRDQHRGARL